MSTENQVNSVLLVGWKAAEPFVYPVGQRINVRREVTVGFDQGRLDLEPVAKPELLVPLLYARFGGRLRILRVEREKNDLFYAFFFDLGERLFG